MIFCQHWLVAQKINYANIDSLKAKRKNSFIITPLVGYQQETRIAYGLASVYIFKTNKLDSTLRASTIPTGVLYTQNDQIIIGLGANIYLPKEKYNIKLENTFTKFPDLFWGIGNDSKLGNAEPYTFTQFFINPQLHRKVLKNFFVGAGWEYQRVFNINYEDGDPNTISNFERDQVVGVYGKSEYKISGGSAYFTYDSRNHAYCPDRGLLLRAKINNTHTNFGSDYNFQVVEIDFRRFIRVYKDQILAIQAYSTMAFGDAPYRTLATLGGNSIMRGFYQGRFRDRMFYGIQAEYRLHLFWRLGMVGFVSAGRVTDYFYNFSLKNLHVAGGAGIRVSLIPKEKLNLRIDFGLTDELNFKPYITIAESF